MAEDFEETLKQHGIGVEIDHFCLASNMEQPVLFSVMGEVESILRAAPAAYMHAPFNELHPAAIDPQALSLVHHRLEQAYLLAESCGIHHMVVHSGYLPHVYFKEWHIERSIEFWDRFMAGKPKHFHIYIENVLEEEPYMLAELYQGIESVNVHGCLDTGHANCRSNVSVAEWAKVLSPYLGHVHLHNNRGDHDFHMPPGEGTADLQEVIDILEGAEKRDRPVTYTLECSQSREGYRWLEESGFL